MDATQRNDSSHDQMISLSHFNDFGLQNISAAALSLYEWKSVVLLSGCRWRGVGPLSLDMTRSYAYHALNTIDCYNLLSLPASEPIGIPPRGVGQYL